MECMDWHKECRDGARYRRISSISRADREGALGTNERGEGKARRAAKDVAPRRPNGPTVGCRAQTAVVASDFVRGPGYLSRP
jgi:hypothetical protein